jgi:TolB protein
MKLFKNPELRGILGLVFVILLIGGIMAVASGKLETWFGISLFSGPKLLDKIVYVSDNSGSRDIYAMNTDGSDQKTLTEGVSVISAPFVSPNGNRVVFVGRFKNETQVFTVRGGGGQPERLTSATGPKQQPAFSPDGKNLAFISSGTVYLTNMNGEGMERALPTEKDTHLAMLDRNSLPAYYTYAWGSDSKSMAGVTKDSNSNDVLVYLPKLDGEAKKMPLSPNERARINDISWASEKPSLAVSVIIGKRSMLGVYDAEVGQLKPVASAEKQELRDTAMSPDGSSVVAVLKSHDKKAPSGLVLVDVESGQGRIIAAGDYESISYSPDGEKLLAVQVSKSGDRDIVVINTTDGQVEKLTSVGHSSDPVWSPVSEK